MLTDQSGKHENSRTLFEILAAAEPLYEKTWRASDDLLEALPAILNKFMPTKILEFGPGLSSYIFYHYQSIMPKTAYIGIDDDNPYAREHQSRLSAFGFDAGYTNICSLDPVDSWYRAPTKLLRAFTPFDLIVIDGPGDDDARTCSRALNLYRECSDPKRTVWIIDDASRQSSSWLSGKWIPDLIQTYKTDHIFDRNHDRITAVIQPISGGKSR